MASGRSVSGGERRIGLLPIKVPKPEKYQDYLGTPEPVQATPASGRSACLRSSLQSIQLLA